MLFLDSHPHYKTYDESNFHMATIPKGILGPIRGVIAKHSQEEPGLYRHSADLLLTNIPEATTTENVWDYISHEIDRALRRLYQNPSKFYDALMQVSREVFGGSIVDDLNQILEDNDVGYILEYSRFGYDWVVREPQDDVFDSLEETEEMVIDICQQTTEHLKQCRNNLLLQDNLRARKDAVRDALSAMESLMKNISGEADIKNATISLRQDLVKWGKQTIVKDGLSIWNHLHDLYPDIRHGNPDITSLTKEEAVYWIDRVTTFVTYIARKSKEGN